MTALAFDPAFRLYHEDPQRRPLETMAEMQGEAIAELADRRRRFPQRVAKGLMAQGAADLEIRVMAHLAEMFALPGIPAAQRTPATWAECVHVLRREILRRREVWLPAVPADQRAAAVHRLELLESLHDYFWNHTADGRAAQAEARAAEPGLFD